GIGPNFSVAIDNTLGSFSPFQGRIYLAYTMAPPRPRNGQPPPDPSITNIQLITADGLSGSPNDFWSVQTALPNVLLGQVDDDALADAFSEGHWAARFARSRSRWGYKPRCPMSFWARSTTILSPMHSPTATAPSLTRRSPSIRLPAPSAS